MALSDPEPIVIHGTAQEITITSGSAVTRIKPDQRPFEQVVVVINGKSTQTLSSAQLQQSWEIRIQSKPGPANPKPKR